MCGRYTLRNSEKAARNLGVSVFEFVERFNVAPTQEMPVVLNREGGRAMQLMRWGYVPYYERANAKPQALINARSETITTKSAYKRAAQRQRCLVPADGFFEWRKEVDGRTRTPFFFALRDEDPFAFAGLWEPATETIPAGYLVLTTSPNELMQPIHDRMPVIVRPAYYTRWLSNEPIAPDELREICTPYSASEMQARPVSRAMNNARVDSPECIASVTEETVVDPIPEQRAKRRAPGAEQLDLGFG